MYVYNPKGAFAYLFPIPILTTTEKEDSPKVLYAAPIADKTYEYIHATTCDSVQLMGPVSSPGIYMENVFFFVSIKKFLYTFIPTDKESILIQDILKL